MTQRSAGAAVRGASSRTPARRAAGGTSLVDTALLLATVAAEGGTPAAALPFEGGTVLRRLLDQVVELGIERVHVITRPGWEQVLEPSVDGQLEVSADAAGDLAAVARIAAGARGGLVVAQAEIVTHRQALAGLLADPRVTTGILSTTGQGDRSLPFRARTHRGRVIAAASPYHAVRRPTTTFLGVLKVGPAETAALAATAERLSALSANPSAAWREQLAEKAAIWRVVLDGFAYREAAAPAGVTAPGRERPEPDALVLSEADEARLRHRVAVAVDEVASLLVVGLVRSGVEVGNSYLNRLFWARPLSVAEAEDAAERITGYDEDRALLDSAVKASDGFFTTFFVSTYSRYIARWAARRGLTPNAVTTFSMFLGLLAGTAFATGHRPGLVAGAVLLQLAFTFDCVDGQLARYTRTFSKLGAWLDSVFDRAKEYAVFAGLAIGAGSTGDPVWLLAACALMLQTVRHTSDFSFVAAAHRGIDATVQPPIEEPYDQPPPREPVEGDDEEEQPQRPFARRTLALWRRLDRAPGAVWVKRMAAFPIGERFAAISVTAAIWGPRTTFIVLLVWGTLAACYTNTGRLLRTVR